MTTQNPTPSRQVLEDAAALLDSLVDPDAVYASLHIANTEDGSYDVHRPLPYPFHVNASGDVLRNPAYPDTRCVGFMRDPDPDRGIDGMVLFDTWADSYTDDGFTIDVVGMFPAFSDRSGMWNSTYPITHVSA